jgi:hypothetical protein
MAKKKDTTPVDQVTASSQIPVTDNHALEPVITRKPPEACIRNITHQVAITTKNLKDKEALKDNKDLATVMLNDIQPQDTIEAMIAGQMIATNKAVMDNLAYASDSKNINARGELIYQATKLTKSFTSLVETLNRYRHRDKVYQNLTVGYVDVHHGGQAVVGNVTQQPT